MPPTLDIHCIAIGGTGMAPLACLLKEQGHRVRGSDGPLYPPMSTLLAEAGITPLPGYDPAHLEPPPDLVVVGNAVPSSNPEAQAAEARGLSRVSMPEALARFFLAGRRPLVVAGTHGKTTTSAMAAWVLEACGADPGYLVGGVPRARERSFRLGGGERFVVEGDEYNAAYFDRGPKFLHYRPETLILTSVEYDHADLYPTPEALVAAYGRLVDLLPATGLLVACGDAPAVREVARRARCRVILYGLEGDHEVAPESVDLTAASSRFVLADPEAGPVEIALPLPGRHNVANALAVWTAARHDGHPVERVAAGLAGFAGVHRRLEEIGTAAGVTVVDDFAHHPTAVAVTLAALRQRHPGRRLVAVFEPRSLTAGRAFFFASYRDAFRGADRLFLAPIFHA
ncbi:MAG: UDP-N-acetylmuramate--L-alanine ligase, partial [Thermoanaerobaculia bacterium]